jgi:hypothetical protein
MIFRVFISPKGHRRLESCCCHHHCYFSPKYFCKALSLLHSRNLDAPQLSVISATNNWTASGSRVFLPLLTARYTAVTVAILPLLTARYTAVTVATAGVR